MKMDRNTPFLRSRGEGARVQLLRWDAVKQVFSPAPTSPSPTLYVPSPKSAPLMNTLIPPFSFVGLLSQQNLQESFVGCLRKVLLKTGVG